MRTQRPTCRLWTLAISSMLVGSGIIGCESAPVGFRSPSVSRARTPEERRKEFPIVHDDWAKLGYRLDWVGYPPVTQGQSIAYIAAYDDLVLVQETGSTLSALKAAGGSTLWSNQLADPLHKFVGVTRGGSGAGKIYAVSSAELFVLDAATGTLIERQRLSNIATSWPLLVAPDVIVVGTGANQVMAHMSVGSTTGVKLWGQGIEGAVRSAPVQVGPLVGAVSDSGEVLFVDPATGSLVRGERMLRKGSGTDPVSDGSTMYVAGLDQSLWAFHPTEGVRWRRQTPHPITSQPVFHDSRVFCTFRETGLNSINPDNGRTFWASKNVRGTPIVFGKNNTAVVWDGIANAWLIDSARGDVIAASTFENIREIRADKPTEGNLYVVSQSGLVAKFVPRS
jgi:outer membrane protein assembly factor BamB